MTVSPGPSRTSAAVYVRKSRSVRPVRIMCQSPRMATDSIKGPAGRRPWLHIQSDGHQEVLEARAVTGFEQARPQRRDQLDDHVTVDRLQAVAQELRVEADLQRFAG